jgi:dTDP-4-amino-4,6-dideoxygalactose transaminase
VIEDAAQGIMSSYKGKALGSIGHLGCYSFHETKNMISGEGGAILINDERFIERAEIIREKGTNRSQFFRGQVDKYTWQDIGSSYLPGELIAAFLLAQLEQADDITQQRVDAWNYYYVQLEAMEKAGCFRRPVVPDGCQINAHMFYILLDSIDTRTALISLLEEHDISTVFHYIPLHSSPAGKKYGRVSGSMEHTDKLSQRILRLPLWVGLQQSDMDKVIAVLSMHRFQCDSGHHDYATPI